MDILTLELFDVTLSQALLEVRDALHRHEGRLRLLLPQDEMMRGNLEKLLAREGRIIFVTQTGRTLQMEVQAAVRTPLADPPPVTVAASLSQPKPQPQFGALPGSGLDLAFDREPFPVLILRSAFSPGDRGLGRQLLLGVLKHMGRDVPWIMLAHDALDLLGDVRAMEILQDLQRKGISIRISRESLRYFGMTQTPFDASDDGIWQSLVGKGEITVL